MARLHLLGDFIQGALSFGASPGVMKDIEEQRTEASGDILNLAWNCKVRVGKVQFHMTTALRVLATKRKPLTNL